MTTQVGLWIDHRKAVIVTLSDEGDATTLVESNVERHVRYSGRAIWCIARITAGPGRGHAGETFRGSAQQVL